MTKASLETLSGFLLIDKPVGPTSHDVIDQLRRLTGLRRIGHAGTLDPLASGLLIVGVGRATKELQTLVGLPKTYEGEVTLGAESSTDDAEGELRSVSERRPSGEELEAALGSLEGVQLQRPPQYSARKLGGQKGYKAARRGETLNLPPKQVQITSFTLTSYDYPRLSFRAEVSSGTYIRSLARDLGSRLGVGAYLSSLRRTRIGPYQVTDAYTVEELQGDWSLKLFNNEVST